MGGKEVFFLGLDLCLVASGSSRSLPSLNPELKRRSVSTHNPNGLQARSDPRWRMRSKGSFWLSIRWILSVNNLGLKSMGACGSKSYAKQKPEGPQRRVSNVHEANPDIKIHTTVTGALDDDHAAAMRLPLGDVTDEQLMAEVYRRHLTIHDKITDNMVKETYEFIEKLGRGASGDVWKVRHRKSRVNFACKIVRKDDNMNDAQSMSTEIEIMKRIRHKNIVSMYEIFETPKCLWILLEIVDGGDLQNYIANHADEHSENTAAIHTRQLLKGLHYLHSCGVVHRDIKLANILLTAIDDNTSIPEVKLADFGLSALVRLGEDGYDPDESSKRKEYTGLVDMWGTKEYFAPELIDCKYGPQVDMWSLGCVLYEMLVGKIAFPFRESEAELFSRIRHAQFGQHRPGWKALSSDAKDMVTQMLHPDPRKRLSASEALLHPWITSHPEAEGRNVHLAQAQEHHKESVNAGR